MTKHKDAGYVDAIQERMDGEVWPYLMVDATYVKVRNPVPSPPMPSGRRRSIGAPMGRYRARGTQVFQDGVAPSQPLRPYARQANARSCPGGRRLTDPNQDLQLHQVLIYQGRL